MTMLAETPASPARRRVHRREDEYRLLTADEEVALWERIRDARAAAEQLEAGVTDPADRRRLMLLVRDGDAARRRFVLANLRLVHSIVRRYSPPPGLTSDDLAQEGNLGLMHAVEKFDGSKGFKFSAYATWWIKQAISRFLDSLGPDGTLPMPSGMGVKFRAVQTAREEATNRGLPLTPDVIAAISYLDLDTVKKLAGVPRMTSLDAPVTVLDDGAMPDRGSVVADGSATDPSAAAGESDQADRLVALLSRLLDGKELAVMRLMYGLDGGEPLSGAEVEDVLGLPRGQAGRIRTRAMAVLAHPVHAGLVEDPLA